MCINTLHKGDDDDDDDNNNNNNNCYYYLYCLFLKNKPLKKFFSKIGKTNFTPIKLRSEILLRSQIIKLLEIRSQ
jgi:hypothetical protein